MNKWNKKKVLKVLSSIKITHRLNETITYKDATQCLQKEKIIY